MSDDSLAEEFSGKDVKWFPPKSSKNQLQLRKQFIKHFLFLSL